MTAKICGEMWPTEQDITLSILSMTDSHLKNAIDHLKRKIAEMKEEKRAGRQALMLINSKEVRGFVESGLDRLESELSEMKNRLAMSEEELNRRVAHE